MPKGSEIHSYNIDFGDKKGLGLLWYYRRKYFPRQGLNPGRANLKRER